uniref:Uncharacterized protein n=1 Tax=Cajanus cajan TaxID=3821 RepID=A0A151U1V5_CAJCA|nr:hypothetical protein KK1_005917 [Cajanus cajan]
MILVQVFISGMQLLSKAILVKGSFIFAIVSYRHTVAAICILPFGIYFVFFFGSLCYSFSLSVIKPELIQYKLNKYL